MSNIDRERRNDRKLSASSSAASASASWRSSFFNDVFEPRPPRTRVHDWVHFNIKNLGDESEFEHLDIDPTWKSNDDVDFVGGGDAKNCSKIRPKSVRKEPFWVKNDGECDRRVSNKIVECWPIAEESSNSKSKRSKEICSKKLSYESTGPHDERYYVKPSDASDSNRASPKHRKSVTPDRPEFSVRSPEPFSLPVNLGTKHNSRSSPSLVHADLGQTGNGQIPNPDYSPIQQQRKSGLFIKKGHKPRISKPSGGLNIWSNAARYKGSLDDILSEDNNDENNKRSAVREIAERIQKQAELDEQRRKEREKASLMKFENQKSSSSSSSGTKSSKVLKKEPVRVMEKISEYDQFRKTSSKLKLKTGLEAKLDSKLVPPFPSQPLPKIPTEYEQFRRPASNRSQPRSEANQKQQNYTREADEVRPNYFVRNFPSEYDQFSKKTEQSSRPNGNFQHESKQRHLAAKLNNKNNDNFGANFRLDGSEEENSRKSSSARSSVESRPLMVDNDDETYSFIMEDQPPLPPVPPPPPPFSSLPVSAQYLRKHDNFFYRRHGDYADPWLREGLLQSGRDSDLSSLVERHSLLRSPPPGLDEVQAKQSHFFNSLFPSRANRFGFPVYPERQFGIPSSRGPPVSFAGFTPEITQFNPEFTGYPADEISLSLLSGNLSKKNNKKKNLINFLKDWIES